ncbi:MAG: triose-phosphate isomerase [Flavobacteriales bacterium]|nr:triose-phosphate isomerase [Bacteroidota bacterium]MCB9240334.1 triose-phosphate isomerase [Flavobacteriales bacterium]
MNRKRFVAGNWKMNTSMNEGFQLLKDIMDRVSESDLETCDVSIFAPFTHLKVFQNTLNGSLMQLGAQNCHHEEAGAYTGEISADMLASVPVAQVLVGHSERRQYFGETNELLAKKVDQVLKHGMQAVYCYGETLDQREDESYIEVVTNQISTGLFHLSAEEIVKVTLAYEPVWAIGTGKTASAGQAQEIHAHTRSILREKYGEEISAQLRILYGGSVKPSNALELFSMPDIDGGLIGGAALNAQSFEAIIKA